MEREETDLKVEERYVSTQKKRKRSKSNDESKDPPKKKFRAPIQREIKPRPKGPRKPYYDEKDREALGKMSKL